MNATCRPPAYTHSSAWRARREDRLSGLTRWRCVVLGEVLDAATIELHHASCEGIIRGTDGQWIAAESDGDLLPVCSGCHHRLDERLAEEDLAAMTPHEQRAATTRAIREIQRAVLAAAVRYERDHAESEDA